MWRALSMVMFLLAQCLFVASYFLPMHERYLDSDEWSARPQTEVLTGWEAFQFAVGVIRQVAVGRIRVPSGELLCLALLVGWVANPTELVVSIYWLKGARPKIAEQAALCGLIFATVPLYFIWEGVWQYPGYYAWLGSFIMLIAASRFKRMAQIEMAGET